MLKKKPLVYLIKYDNAFFNEVIELIKAIMIISSGYSIGKEIKKFYETSNE